MPIIVNYPTNFEQTEVGSVGHVWSTEVEALALGPLPDQFDITSQGGHLRMVDKYGDDSVDYRKRSLGSQKSRHPGADP